ncbi:MAG: FAD-binding oxidoreductase [Phaeodactylibacter sp.]|nr:FAD-binding oxidoreductase [Phaeodactylibacter sp.]
MPDTIQRSLSFWEWESYFSGVDLLIVGSGIVGMCAALEWKHRHPDQKVVIVERGSFPAGASTRNAGFACFGSLTELLDDLRSGSEDQMLQLVERRWLGLQRLLHLLGPQHIQFEPCGGYELFQQHESTQLEEVLEALPRFNRLLAPIIGQSDTFIRADAYLSECGFSNTRALIKNQAEGALNTGAMMRRLQEKVQRAGVLLLHGVTITGLQDTGSKVVVQSEAGWDWAVPRALVTVNGFAQQLLPELKNVRPARNQVLITKALKRRPFTGTFHYDRGYFYFRHVGNRILLGGGRNLAPQEEETMHFGAQNKIRTTLEKMLREQILPGQAVEIDRWWSGIMGVGSTKTPVVQMISARIGVAVRLGGMGVAIGSLVGKEAAELLEH